jgi:hypothetical protein
MKRKIAWLGVILSALYLITIGILPDPLPLVDEGIALAVLLRCSSYLGYDLRKWVPFLPRREKPLSQKPNKIRKDITIDV